MYLPQEIPQTRVLVTVKTYPLPSGSYGELVCTAGLLNGEKWVRIYPIPFRFLNNNRRYPKYSWIRLDLVKAARDFRPESYCPRRGIDEPIAVEEKLGTENHWAARKSYVLREVFTSMDDLIRRAKGDEKKSLATLKPLEIVDFEVQPAEREWKEIWLAQNRQGNIFETDASGRIQKRHLVRKLPYRYFYKFLCEGDNRPRRLKIEDWEIGALFWNCLQRADGDEETANKFVRRKYFDTFREKKDLYLFVGTTKQYHNRSRNPFLIVGVFYPPKTAQMALF